MGNINRETGALLNIIRRYPDSASAQRASEKLEELNNKKERVALFNEVAAESETFVRNIFEKESIKEFVGQEIIDKFVEGVTLDNSEDFRHNLALAEFDNWGVEVSLESSERSEDDKLRERFARYFKKEIETRAIWVKSTVEELQDATDDADFSKIKQKIQDYAGQGRFKSAYGEFELAKFAQMNFSSLDEANNWRSSYLPGLNAAVKKNNEIVRNIDMGKKDTVDGFFVNETGNETFVSGKYDWLTGKTAINLERFVTLANTMTDSKEECKTTAKRLLKESLLHEFGHHISLFVPAKEKIGIESSRALTNLFDKAYRGGAIPYSYSSATPEVYAEMFSYFHSLRKPAQRDFIKDFENDCQNCKISEKGAIRMLKAIGAIK